MNEAKQSLNDYLSKPLVDQKTASDLKSNCESLLKVGVKPDIDVLRYIKLAEYERRNALRCGNCAYNYGLWTGSEDSVKDIVCDYWVSEGLKEDDYCSQAVALEEYTARHRFN